MTTITLQQNALAEALGIVTRASKPSGLLPAFELVRLEAAPGRLTLSCFNGEYATCGTLPAQCLDLASACVHAGTLREVVNAVSGEVTLHFGETELRVECGSNKANLRISQEALPAIEPVEQGESLELTGRAG